MVNILTTAGGQRSRETVKIGEQKLQIQSDQQRLSYQDDYTADTLFLMNNFWIKTRIDYFHDQLSMTRNEFLVNWLRDEYIFNCTDICQ